MRWERSMLLCLSSGDMVCYGRLGFWFRAWKVRVDFAGDVALEAADDFALAQAFVSASFDVGAGGFMVTHAHDRHDVERAVGGSVAAAAQSVPAGGAAAAGGLWRDTAKLGESGFVVDAVGVVAGGNEELPGQFNPNAE